MNPTPPSHTGTPNPCIWLADRLPLTGRITGRYQSIWALHAEGHHDEAVAAQLGLSPAAVRTAIRSIYRALAIDPDDGALARAQARQLYRAFTSTRTNRSDDLS